MVSNGSAVVSVVMVATMAVMMFGAGVEPASTGRGSIKAPPFPGPSHTHGKSSSPSISDVPEKHESSPIHYKLSRRMKRWLLTTKPTAPERTSKTAGGTNAYGGPDGPSRVSTGTTDPEKQAQMLKMISALQELYKTMNSTLRMRITLIPRANGKNPGRKNKGMPAEGSVRPSMVPPMEMGNTTSRTSAEVLMPSSLTGRNFKKVLPSQPKKPNKRVCFWKYCSQN